MNSPDSDYDLRFIYVRPREFYLRLDKTRDVIDPPPLSFDRMARKFLPEELKSSVQELLRLKRSGSETIKVKPADGLIQYCEHSIRELNRLLSSFPPKTPPSREEVNPLFLSLQ